MELVWLQNEAIRPEVFQRMFPVLAGIPNAFILRLHTVHETDPFCFFEGPSLQVEIVPDWLSGDHDADAKSEGLGIYGLEKTRSTQTGDVDLCASRFRS